MIFQMLHKIQQIPGLSHSEKSVMIALFTFANSEGICWPAVETIASYAGCSARTVQRALLSLHAGKWVGIAKRENESSIYTLAIKRILAVEGSHAEKAAKPEQVTGDTASPPGDTMSPQGCHRITPLVTPCHPPGDTMSPKLTIKQTTEETSEVTTHPAPTREPEQETSVCASPQTLSLLSVLGAELSLALEQTGIHTLEELFEAGELRYRKGIGPSRAAQITAKLTKQGITKITPETAGLSQLWRKYGNA